MDEDKALGEIRKLTYNDDPGFITLMDMVIDMATKYKEEYQRVAKSRKISTVCDFLSDMGIDETASVPTFLVKKGGIYMGSKRVSEGGNVILRQTPYVTYLIDTKTGDMYHIERVPVEGVGPLSSQQVSIQMVEDTNLLSIETPTKLYLISNRGQLRVSDTHISINRLNDNPIPKRAIIHMDDAAKKWLANS